MTRQNIDGRLVSGPERSRLTGARVGGGESGSLIERHSTHQRIESRAVGTSSSERARARYVVDGGISMGAAGIFWLVGGAILSFAAACALFIRGKWGRIVVACLILAALLVFAGPALASALGIGAAGVAGAGLIAPALLAGGPLTLAGMLIAGVGIGLAAAVIGWVVLSSRNSRNNH